MGAFRLTRVLPREYVIEYGRAPTPGRAAYCVTVPSTNTPTRPGASSSNSSGGSPDLFIDPGPDQVSWSGG